MRELDAQDSSQSYAVRLVRRDFCREQADYHRKKQQRHHKVAPF